MPDRAVGASSGCSCPAGMLIPGSLLLFQPSNGNQHPARRGRPLASSGSGVRAEAGGRGAGTAGGTGCSAELGAGEPRCTGRCSLVMCRCPTG